jgi:serine/threonine protein kinase
MGAGVNGATYLRRVNWKSAEKAVVEKRTDADEVSIMHLLTERQRSKEETHIPTMLSYKQCEGRLMMLISACEGGSLAQLGLPQMRDKNQISAEVLHAYLFRVVHDVSRALVHAHTMGVAHCDMKPENIFLDREGRAYLGDWGHGVRCRTGQTVDLEAKKRLVGVGTPYFVPPETLPLECLAKANVSVSQLADSWGVGALIGLLLGEVYEVALVRKSALPKLPCAQFYQLFQAAEAKYKELDEWSRVTVIARHQLAILASQARSGRLFNSSQLHILLKNLALALCAPERMRMNSQDLLSFCQKVARLVPDVEVKYSAATGLLLPGALVRESGRVQLQALPERREVLARPVGDRGGRDAARLRVPLQASEHPLRRKHLAPVVVFSPVVAPKAAGFRLFSPLRCVPDSLPQRPPKELPPLQVRGVTKKR